jgi:hypothetical protein
VKTDDEVRFPFLRITVENVLIETKTGVLAQKNTQMASRYLSLASHDNSRARRAETFFNILG